MLAVVEENKLNEVIGLELEFRDMVESIIRQNYETFHSNFQFGWIGSPEIAHSIVMSHLATPHLIVLNSTTYEHYIPDDEPEQLTADAIKLFLHNIRHEKVKVRIEFITLQLIESDLCDFFSMQVYGGNSFLIRIYRTYFEGKRYLHDMWRGNPILTSVLFGLPLGFLSLIMYSIFCADILDADEDEEEECLYIT